MHDDAAASWVEPAQRLVELGADINAEDDDGWTPLDVVRDRRFLPELARWMKSKGAIRGKRGRT